MLEAAISNQTLCHAGPMYPVAKGRKRNLGGAILLAAIEDYRGKDGPAHRDAEAFLYPRTSEGQNHYDWAVGVAEGVNPAWLRDVLDRYKAEWDGQREQRMTPRHRREVLSAHRRRP